MNPKPPCPNKDMQIPPLPPYLRNGHTCMKKAQSIETMGVAGGGTGGSNPPHFLKWGGYSIICPPHFFELKHIKKY